MKPEIEEVSKWRTLEFYLIWTLLPPGSFVSYEHILSIVVKN